MPDDDDDELRPERSAVRVRPARAEDRERMLDLWERSVRATHHFLTQADVVSRTRAGGRSRSST